MLTRRTFFGTCFGLGLGLGEYARSGAQPLDTTEEVHPTKLPDVLGQWESPSAGSVGIPTGFRELDMLTGGLHESELILLTSPPGTGKTALALNIAEQAATVANVPTLFVSLDHARYSVANRMLCSRATIDTNKARCGFFSEDDRRKLAEASVTLQQAPFFVDDTPNRSLAEIAACARSMKRREQLGLLIIDCLQLILPENVGQHRQKQLATMAQELKALASELEIAVLCLTQSDQYTEAVNEENCLKILRVLGKIDRSADVVLFLHREDVESPEEGFRPKIADERVELIVAKQSGGPIGTVPLAWCGKYARFETLPESRFGEFDECSPA